MSLTLKKFNDNFIVTIVHFDNESGNVTIHFKVQSTINSKVSIHKSTVDTKKLSKNFTQKDIISSAWDLIKRTVKIWSICCINEDQLIEYTVTSTSNVIDVSTFNNNFLVKVIRFDLVPSVNPSSWCIGFSVCIRNNESVLNNYEGLISIETQYNDNDKLCKNITDSAWELIKDNVCNWAVSKLPSNNILNITFLPTYI